VQGDSTDFDRLAISERALKEIGSIIDREIEGRIRRLGQILENESMQKNLSLTQRIFLA
jgi:hypothetical protein